jgi:hypothetical protein
VISEVNKKEKSKSQRTQVCGIPLSTVSTHLKDSIEQEALQGGDVSRQRQYMELNLGDMENEALEWFQNE